MLKNPRKAGTRRTPSASIVTESDTLEELRETFPEAVECDFDEHYAQRSMSIRLHVVHVEVLAL